MLGSGRDPDGLMRRTGIVRVARSDAERSARRVFELMERMRVPAGRDARPIVDVCAGLHCAASSQIDHAPGRGRRTIGRLCSARPRGCMPYFAHGSSVGESKVVELEACPKIGSCLGAVTLRPRRVGGVVTHLLCDARRCSSSRAALGSWSGWGDRSARRAWRGSARRSLAR